MFEINLSYNFSLLNGLFFGGVFLTSIILIMFEGLKKFIDRSV